MHSPFKICPTCAQPWATREDFLGDAGVTIVGYQVHWEELELGLMYFNHTCGTTMAIQVSEFTDLYDGPVFTGRATGTDACPGHCLHRGNLRPCPARCECAYIRAVIQAIKAWPKRMPEQDQPED